MMQTVYKMLELKSFYKNNKTLVKTVVLLRSHSDSDIFVRGCGYACCLGPVVL